ncbi:MAG: hypothetical protein NTY46_01200 [Candidatus Sumerlaeota bacterium]|nr:hypothetical protein [Candidatus Sumerlaeota bacterium]
MGSSSVSKRADHSNADPVKIARDARQRQKATRAREHLNIERRLDGFCNGE